MAATATAQDPCLVLDDGTGTVDLPPPGCDYLSPDEVHEIIDGLPPGTTIKLAPIHNEFICRQGGGGPHCGTPGGSLGGDVENFDSFMQLRLQGTGPLAPFVRRLTIPILCQTHTGPRTAGDPVQTFPTTMWSLQGSLVGDPDFAQLNIRAGDAFGLPSPGQTTLTDLGNGNWQVDSFFDITYEIDYVGAPGGALAGLAGTTQATLRMQASAGAIPPPCGPLADQSACNSGICAFPDQCVPIAMKWVPGGPQLVTDCSCQDPTLCHVDFGPVSPICVGSCPPGQVCQIFSADFDGDGIDEAWACDCIQSTGCGDGQCIAPEDQCNCPVDCGTPPAIETSCTDGVDNDCDTLIDCLDPDCANDPACGPVPCDVSDPATCSGFCPPDEVCTPDPLGPCKCVPVPCAQSDPATCGGSCPAGGGICLPGPAGTACSCQHCGDGVCDATVGEDQCSCPIDCGTPPATETSCTDGVDNDCDTLIDCLDPDCANDPACGPVPCAQSDPAICNGTCPPDEVCTPTPALCVCLPVPCDQSDPATCGGSCPPDQVCTLDALGQCTCVPVPCPQSDPATCGGSCPPGTGVCLPGAAGIACSCQTCGDGICDPIIGEDQCTCPVDCGTPPGNEVPNLTCQDGLDNDCDNLIDCLDPDCANDPACQPNVCPEPGGFPGPCANLQTTDCQSTAAGTCLPKCVNYIPGTTIVQATQCGCIDPAECHVVMPVAPGARVPNPCEVIDAGGTVQLPPIGCDYLTADEVHLILNDLPAGTTIELDPIHTPIFCKQGPGTSGFPGCPPPGICEQPGGALGGNVDCFDSTLQLTVSGTGTLGTFNRILNVPVGCQVQSAPRTPGDPVQDFDTEMVFLQGELFGDPDFCTFRVTGGTGFGLPSPGHTTLTQLPSGNWNVDSFFDVTYRIEFVGCPGSILDGLSGTTVAGLRMETGGGGQVPSCDGICPPGTRCVEQRTFNADGSVDLCCNCEPIICNITAVRSCKIHTDITGQSRRLCIDLGDQGTAPDGTPFTKNVEPRLGQTDDVEIDLTSVAGFGGGVTVSCTDNAGNVTDETGRVSGVTVTGNTVNIKFAPALPDETACVITLDCGAQTCIRTLRGDVDRNGRVTTGDASQVRFWFNQCPPFPVPPEFDVDQLNCVTTGDFSQIRFFFNNVAPACP